MLAVLRNGVPLTSATSTSTAWPETTAPAAASRVCTPTSRAKWLSVPAGSTASGRPEATATAAAAATLPSPPATPSARAQPGDGVPGVVPAEVPPRVADGHRQRGERGPGRRALQRHAGDEGPGRGGVPAGEGVGGQRLVQQSAHRVRAQVG